MSDDPTGRSADRTDRPDDEDDHLDEGDSLDGLDEGGGARGSSAEIDGAPDDDPFDEIDADPDGDLFSGPIGTGGRDGADADPFAELDDEGATPDPGGDPFERIEVDEVDVDDVWNALEEDPDDVADAAFPEGDSREPTDHVVDKRTYCHRCPNFSDPPETACTHEDASILEAVGFEEFRVRDCPMVTDDGPRFDRHGRLDE
ncbi:hypothetical protein ACFPM1_12470 [Halorubrum rubrum]|uniref:DUF8135 domain-containing protein n=1 Tax=Halorubrum rubrum TaxID=1126240 RepID=A0ABD5R3S3_9EURY|nr:hypothetical protein [Halorubrum rubrum]